MATGNRNTRSIKGHWQPAEAAGSPSAASCNEKVEVDLAFRDNIIAVQIIDVATRFCQLLHTQSTEPHVAWDAVETGGLEPFGAPLRMESDSAC